MQNFVLTENFLPFTGQGRLAMIKRLNQIDCYNIFIQRYLVTLSLALFSDILRLMEILFKMEILEEQKIQRIKIIRSVGCSDPGSRPLTTVKRATWTIFDISYEVAI